MSLANFSQTQTPHSTTQINELTYYYNANSALPYKLVAGLVPTPPPQPFTR